MYFPRSMHWFFSKIANCTQEEILVPRIVAEIEFKNPDNRNLQFSQKSAFKPRQIFIAKFVFLTLKNPYVPNFKVKEQILNYRENQVIHRRNVSFSDSSSTGFMEWIGVIFFCRKFSVFYWTDPFILRIFLEYRAYVKIFKKQIRILYLEGYAW